MKIRIRGNTVRYRLSKSEVSELASTGRLEEKTEFLTDTLVYAIKKTGNDEMSADLTRNTITLYVPEDALQIWAGSDQVGMEKATTLPSGKALYLLLEKDFKCIDAEIKEDQSDYFENPHLNC